MLLVNLPTEHNIDVNIRSIKMKKIPYLVSCNFLKHTYFL